MISKALLCFAFMTTLTTQGRFGGPFEFANALYSSSDPVTILNSTNFERTVFGTVNALLVEFYASWCGDCVRFSPTWKAFAADVYGWKKVMEVGVVECSDEVNEFLCRKYKVVKYPTIKFFPQRSDATETGIPFLSEGTVDDLRRTAVELLENEQATGRGSLWPNMTPFSGRNSADLWNEASPDVKFIFIVCEVPESHLGREVTLDFADAIDFQIRRATSDNAAFMEFLGVSRVPSLFAVHRVRGVVAINTPTHERKVYGAAIVDFLKNGGMQVTDTTPENNNNLLVPDVETTPTVSNDPLTIKPDVVYQADLLKAMLYTLKQEISIQDTITGDALTALRNYLDVLEKYFPSNAQVHSFLYKLNAWVLNQGDAVSGESFMNQVYMLEKEVGIPRHDWIGCKGSSPNLRGYPCGLWTMFHTLTVNQALQMDQNFNPLDVLNAIVGYVKYFFGCNSCSKEFQNMATTSMYKEVKEGNDGVIWLWKAHNEANNRLKGDVTEDPEHPKIQFPSEVNCPSCRNENGSWNQAGVQSYLSRIYNKDNISNEGLGSYWMMRNNMDD